jgi:hypothetical protein
VPIRCHFSSDHTGDAAACRRPHSRALISSNSFAAPSSIPRSARNHRHGLSGRACVDEAIGRKEPASGSKVDLGRQPGRAGDQSREARARAEAVIGSSRRQSVVAILIAPGSRLARIRNHPATRDYAGAVFSSCQRLPWVSNGRQRTPTDITFCDVIRTTGRT